MEAFASDSSASGDADPFCTPEESLPRPNKRKNDADKHDEANESDRESGTKRRKVDTPLNTSYAKIPGYVSAAKLLSESQRTQLYDFMQEEPADREAWLFAEILILHNKVSALAQGQENVDPAIHAIVEKIVIAVFVSGRTESYTPHALNSLMDLPKLWRPFDWDASSKESRVYVESEVLRTRTRFEREIRSSISSPSLCDHMHINQLSRNLVAPAGMRLTVETCARVALMRSVMDDIAVKDFWIALDQKLLSLSCGLTAMSGVRAFNNILADDVAKHGDDMEPFVEPDRNAVDTWQKHVERNICGFIYPLAAAQVYL
ncbi:hypothetical protein Hypma_016612 [Hypsizygus marmoreus]|uniref:Uncharacterized protein n=1 Tax=Hypsizygus marmoreus TaxID=39966 RepID=A0A369IZD8_HYPMA|nr:hypothetical protein Hypma_016612 [Hypsizygus marmoreus]